MASAADLELLWTRIEVEIDLPHAPTRSAAVRGVSKLWVLPINPKPRKHVRLHCRQCKVTGVTINGIPATSWESLDPHGCLVRSPELVGDGEALETFSRAAFLAAHDGELAIRLPALGPSSQPPPKYLLPDEINPPAQEMKIATNMDIDLSASTDVGSSRGVDAGSGGSSSLDPSSRSTPSSMLPRAAESRARCLSAMRTRLAACAGTHGKPLLIEVSYEIEDPKGGFECTRPHSGGGVLMHTCGGGGFGSTTGVDLDGARCRWPCLDGSSGTHQAPVELMVKADARHACVASGQRLLKTAEDEGEAAFLSSLQGSLAINNAVAVPSWVQARVEAAASATAAIPTTSPSTVLLEQPTPVGQPPSPHGRAFRQHAWFVGPHCPMRGVGLVVGTALTRLPSPRRPPQPSSSSPNLPQGASQPFTVTPPPLDVWVSQSASGNGNEITDDAGGDDDVIMTATTTLHDAVHSTNGLAAACMFCGDVLGTGGEFPEPNHTQVWMPTLQLEDTLVFANLTLVSRRLLHGSTVAEPQLPGHLLQLRALLLAYLLPLVKLNTVASDGWLLAGISGWLVLRWAERALGDDHHRLMLLRLHDAVVRREARMPDVAPISRGGAYARLKPTFSASASSSAGMTADTTAAATNMVDGAWEASADESLLGLAATEDPLLMGAKSMDADERAHWHAKSTLVMHMLEQRLGADGRDSLLRAIHLSLLPGLDLLTAPPCYDQPQPSAGPWPASGEEEKATDLAGNATTTNTVVVPGGTQEGGSDLVHGVEWAPALDTLGFFGLATVTPGSGNGGSGSAVSLLSSGGGAGDAFGGWLEQWVRCSGAALLKVAWEYNKSKHEIELTIEQVVPPWRSHHSSSSSNHGGSGGEGGSSGDGSEAAGHHGCFQGLLQIRIVEVDDLVVDHQRVIGSETQYTFAFKCQTNKSRMRKRPSSSLSSGGGSSGDASADDGSGECPVLWIKVDPDYAWMRELVMKQPFDSWLEQLGRDGDADAQVLSLRAIATELPIAGETTKVPHAKPPAVLADVVRGVPLPLPSAWLTQPGPGAYYNAYSNPNTSSGGGSGYFGGSASEAHGWGVRVEAADALARWQAMHAPRSGVASLAGSWRGRDLLRQCLLDLFTDEHTSTPMPLGCRVVRAINHAATSSSSSSSESGGVLSRGAFATSALHVSVLEALATCRAQNGATSLAGARALLQAIGYADDEHDEQPILAFAGECALTRGSAGSSSSVVGFWRKEKKKRKKEGGTVVVDNSSSSSSSSARSLDKSYALARLLGCLGEVFLRHDEVNQEVEHWRLAAQEQAQRLFYADSYRGSHLGIVRAAALQALGALSLLSAPSAPSSSNLPSTSSTGPVGTRINLNPAADSSSSGNNSGANSTTSATTIAAKDWYLKAWSGSEQPDLVRLVAIVGTVQQHTASGQAALVVEGLRWALKVLFGGHEDIDSGGGSGAGAAVAAAADNKAGGTSGTGGDGVDHKRKRSAASPSSSSTLSNSSPPPTCSKWLQLNAIVALDEWAKGSGSIEPGGVLTGQDLLFADQRLPGLTGGACPAWKAWYAPDAARLPPSPRPKQLAKLFRDLLRGACGYPVREPIAKDHAHLQPPQQQKEAGADASSAPAVPVNLTAVPPPSDSGSSSGNCGVGGGVTPKQQLRRDAQHLCLELWHLANGGHSDVAHCAPLRVALQHLWSTLLGQDVPPVVALRHHQACDPRSLVGGLDGTLLSPAAGTTAATATGAGTPGEEVGPTPTAWVQPLRLRNEVPPWANPDSGLEGIYRHVRAQRRKRLPQVNWVEEARSAAAAHALALAEGAAAAAAAAKKPRPDDRRIIRIKNSAPAPTPSSSSSSDLS